MDSNRLVFNDYDPINHELEELNKAHRLEKYIAMKIRDSTNVIKRRHELQQRIQALESEISSFHLKQSLMFDSGHTGNSFFSHSGALVMEPWQASGPMMKMPPATRPPPPASFIHDMNTVGFPNLSETFDIPFTSDLTDGSSSRKRPSSAASNTSANKRTKLLNDNKTPCLRCKILKKKCDTEDTCSHCPQQSFDNENDYWKVLGCVRGQLRDMANVFCPDFARESRRMLKCQSGNLLVVDFVLTKSRVSIGKKKRMLQLLQNRLDFAELYDSSWDNTENRKLLSQFAQTQTGTCGEDELTTSLVSFEDYEAIWALLQTVAMDPVYTGPTEYNVFTLLRVGNSCLKDAPASWEIFRQSKALLRQAVELYLLERLCGHIASGDLTGSPPFDPTKLPQSNTLILVDIKGDMEAFLDNFERLCAGRGRLTGHSQLACFYALVVFSIVKGLLIDAYSVRNTCDDVNPWDETYALRITSAFKTLVSVFNWSSKQDVMLQNQSDLVEFSAIPACRNMLKVEKWEERGFKSSRDFLLNLGSLILPNDSYNGFFKQKYGLEKVPVFLPNIQSPINTSKSIVEGLQSKSQNPTLPRKTPTPFKVHKFSSAPVPVELDCPGSPDTLSPEPELSSASESEEAHSNFTFVGENRDGEETVRRSLGGRRGGLNKEKLKKFRELRKIGACWNCWVMKVPCSEGHPCQRCNKLKPNSTSPVCNRSPFSANVSLFFPEYFNSRFTTELTDRYVNENIQGFTDQSLPVTFSWIGQPHLELNATIFSPTPDSKAQKNYTGHLSRTLGVRSLPIGLSPLDTEAAGKAIMLYLEDVLENQFNEKLFSANISADIWPEISRKSMETISRFYHVREEKDPVLHDVLLFYLNLSLMSSPIMFTQSSAELIDAKIGDDLPDCNLFSSRMLDRQIKHILYLENRKILEHVLSNLEKLIRGRKPSSWATVFCTTLVLAYSIEALQSQAQIHFSTLQSNCDESEKETAKKRCQALDDIPFAQLKHLFHTIYRTYQPEKGGLNPFMVNGLGTEKMDLDAPAMDMIGGMKDVIAKLPNRTEFELPDFSGVGRQDFGKLNSGRLLGSFLEPFGGNSENAKVWTLRGNVRCKSV